MGDSVSVIIPSRNEQWLNKTVQDVLVKAVGDIEIQVLFDGWDLNPVGRITQKECDKYKKVRDAVYGISGSNNNVKVLTSETPIGQRKFINKAVRQTNSKYIFKIDAHCAVIDGFDVILKSQYIDNTFMTPAIWTFNPETWKAKASCCTFSYLDFDLTPRTSADFEKSQNIKNNGNKMPEIMAFRGESWFLTSEFWWKLGGYDETLGNWGSTGTEFSLKTWLMGYRMLVNKNVTVAHMYRDKRFPYKDSGMPAKVTGKIIRHRFLTNQALGQIYPVEWLIDKFWPIPSWDRKTLTESERTRFA